MNRYIVFFSLAILVLSAQPCLAHPFMQNYLVNELKSARISLSNAHEDMLLKDESGALESTFDNLIKASQLFTCYPAVRSATAVSVMNTQELPLIGYDPTGTVGLRINLIVPKKNPNLNKYSYFIISLEYQGIETLETQNPLDIRLVVSAEQSFKRLDVYNDPKFQNDFGKLANRHKLPSRFEPKSMSAIHAAFFPASLNYYSVNSFQVDIEGTKIVVPNILFQGRSI